MKSLRFILFLVLFSIYLASLASAQEAGSQTSTPKLQPHPWWSLTQAQIQSSFDYGRQAQRTGMSRDSMVFQATPVKTIASDITLFSVCFMAPPGALQFMGFQSEFQMKPEEDMQKCIFETWNNSKNSADFSIFLISNSQLDSLYAFTFSLETDQGVRLSPLQKSKPDTSVGHTDLSSWFNASYVARFPLYAPSGILAIHSETKWVRLWIVGIANRVPITFWLDGSARIIVGQPE